MKTFAKKFPTFWTGATARQLNTRRLGEDAPYGKLLADYFFTSPAAVGADNYGIYYVEQDMIRRHLEVDEATLTRVITALAELHLAYYDQATEWVFVREAAAWQYGAPLMPRDFNCTNARRFYRSLPKNPWLGPWFDRYFEDFCLQHDEDAGAWVERREWPREMPAIAQHLVLPPPAATARTAVRPPATPAPEKPATKKADKSFIARVLHRLRSLKMNGAIGTQLNIAITQVEQGDVNLVAIERQLLDVVIQELGPQVEEAAIAEVGEFRSRMPAPEFSTTLARAKDSAARRIVNLPTFIES